MKVAVLGYASQGASTYEYWQNQGADITVCDRDEHVALPAGASSQLGTDYLANLDRFDLIVRTPSIHPRDITNANTDSRDILNKVTTNTNEFMRACPTKNIIGVTGTKGKGTTSTLIARMLESAGKRVHLGGNIGTPPLEMLKNGIESDDWVVLELANFQLIDIKHSPRIGVCVMVVGEHLDWHANVNEYVTAKQQLFRWQQPEDTAIYYSKNALSQQIASVGNGKKIPYYEKPGARVENELVIIEDAVVCSVSEIKLLGKHNWQNVCAAVTAVWPIVNDARAIREAINHTSGLPYRLEHIGDVNNIHFYNDSFGTTPETAIVAIEALSEPKVLITGGSDKGADYKELAQAIVNGNVKAVITVGITGPTIAKHLKDLGHTNIIQNLENMTDMVNRAYELAEPGDTILLSAGSASFGLFKDYKDRGDQFNAAVRSLA